MDDLQKKAKETADAKRLRANVKALNMLYDLAKEEGQDDLTIFKDNKIKFMQLTGSESKRGHLLNLGKASKNKRIAQELLALTDKVLSSEWVTPDGRKRIYEKAKTTTKNKYTLSQEQHIRLTDLFNNRVIKKMKEAFVIPSTEIIRLVKLYDVEEDTVVNIFEQIFANYEEEIKNDINYDGFNPYNATSEELIDELEKRIRSHLNS